LRSNRNYLHINVKNSIFAYNLKTKDMVLTFFISAMLATRPMDTPKEVVRFSTEMILENEITIPKPIENKMK